MMLKVRNHPKYQLTLLEYLAAIQTVVLLLILGHVLGS